MRFNIFDSGSKGELHMKKWLEGWSVRHDRQGADKTLSAARRLRRVTIMSHYLREQVCILNLNDWGGFHVLTSLNGTE